MKRRYAILTGLALLTSACAYQGGLKNVGSETLPDGSIIVGIEATTTMEGPQVSGLQTYRCHGVNGSVEGSKATCAMEQVYSATGPSLWQSVLTGLASNAAQGLAYGLPAALLKPDNTSIQQGSNSGNIESYSHGGGSTATGGSSEVVNSPTIAPSIAPVVTSTSDAVNSASSTSRSRSRSGVNAALSNSSSNNNSNDNRLSNSSVNDNRLTNSNSSTNDNRLSNANSNQNQSISQNSNTVLSGR
jgi:hypothetical protein